MAQTATRRRHAAPKTKTNPESAAGMASLTRKQKRTAALAAAKEQAAADARIATPEVTVELRPGKPLGLHELNAMAKATNKKLRDDAKNAAQAAGRAAYDVLSGKGSADRNSMAKRFRTIAAADKNMAAATKEAAARAEREAAAEAK